MPLVEPSHTVRSFLSWPLAAPFVALFSFGAEAGGIIACSEAASNERTEEIDWIMSAVLR